MKKQIYLVFGFFIWTAVLWADALTIPDAARLHLRIKKLAVVGGALYIAAHPDDENTAVLSYLSMGRLVRTAYLALNRGEGGQNLIGPEQGDLLGVIRTQELLAARAVDEANQFFTRAVDFGFSKSSEESLQKWGHEKVLSDVVWVIRKFRPDVIILRFPPEGGGHGHHTASAILGREAFHAAGDPTKFPEQLKYVSVWQPRRIVWNRFSWGNQPITEEEKKTLAKMETGEYNPLLGKSYTELAGIGRSMHKSQGFGDSEDRGKFTNYFRPIAGEPARVDLFEGFDLTWKRIPGAEKLDGIFRKIDQEFDPEKPARSIPALLNAYQIMTKIPENPWIAEKKQEVLEVIRDCAGLWLEAIASDQTAVAGSSVEITTTAINRSDFPLKLLSVEIESTNTVDVKLSCNEPVSRKIMLSIPVSAPYTVPYWLERSNAGLLAEIQGQQMIGLAESPAPFSALFIIQAGGHPLKYRVPVRYRWVDPVRGERYTDFLVAPEVTAEIQQPVVLFPDIASHPIQVVLTAGSGPLSGDLWLELPGGWKCQPEKVPFQFVKKGDSLVVRFEVSPLNGEASSGIFRAVASVQGKRISRRVVKIDYPHIPMQIFFPPAEGKIILLDAKITGKNIGYIMGSGDTIPDILRQLGYQVTLLSDEDLVDKDLAGFDAIVTGVRAYNTRDQLKVSHSRLLQYVREGGTLVVQYNTLQGLILNQIGPYPFQISRERVSVEEAPVQILNLSHPLFYRPNRITPEDFNGWVQERGLYFISSWDPKYEVLLETKDPGEPPRKGGLLYTEYGKGIFIYTSYSWFRQLPAGVSGAIRLFVNLISARQQ